MLLLKSNNFKNILTSQWPIVSLLTNNTRHHLQYTLFIYKPHPFAPFLDQFDSVEIGNININMNDSASRRNTNEGIGASPASNGGDIELHDLSKKQQKGGYELDSIASTDVSRPASQQIFVNPPPAKEKTWMQRLCPCFTLEFFAQYFDVTSEEIKIRLSTSLIPFNQRFHVQYKGHPDLYGPFWIYTTLIIILAIAGNLSRYIQLGKEDFTYNYNFVPIAATVIYSLALGLPLGLKLLMRLLGTHFFNGTFLELVGIYGYSFTSFLITALLCLIPIQFLQWIFITYSAVTSTGFLFVTMWHELADTSVPPKTRLTVIAAVSTVQVGFLLIFKMYFFQNVARS
ncbi:hypothetical protein FGO68_gene6677 [Halteria grandinella]|uniref:Protein YIPF n=1 Tax=Halteria grandinella TaxID=5974 RepID=A0A8J8NUH5_HALGN|nr:hypothetical protein FGO68_gene6677 [Halteria grandinella]